MGNVHANEGVNHAVPADDEFHADEGTTMQIHVDEGADDADHTDQDATMPTFDVIVIGAGPTGRCWGDADV